ncbi:MAG: GH116 family glycosyl hydrolase [Kiritimatiellae bacterium]|jgi:uncharacterized protein (DUF608 family)|nr:GH116 family glycosyl hydrolase [Kiritimatiellia bacterium]
MKDKKIHHWNGPYENDFLSRVAFPLGGIGAGMVCVEGSGAFSHLSVRNTPDVFNEPPLFAAIHIQGHEGAARLLEGPVPPWKIFGSKGAANGAHGCSFGLPRFDTARFGARFPFARIDFTDPSIPLRCSLNAWSPFLPGNSDDSSLPLAVLDYTFENATDTPIDFVFSFHASNFMALPGFTGNVDGVENGFVLRGEGSDEKPAAEGSFAVTLPDPDTSVDCAWFRGGWFDAASILWRHVEQGDVIAQPPVPSGERASPGGSVYLRGSVPPGERHTIPVLLTWHVPGTELNFALGEAESGTPPGDRGRNHVPWYADRFATIHEITDYAKTHVDRLRTDSLGFSDTFYDNNLPPEVTEAVAANLSILKSPTVLRQTDGRLWAWEGCCDQAGCCAGSCTHVWNYAQALPHLFPDLERSLRQTEYHENQDSEGHQVFRALLPIQNSPTHEYHAAADGQLGGIMKMFREWRISGDTQWLTSFWPKMVSSLDYCIRTWDPDREGVLREPHHNTYDIEFWGGDGMCTSFYLGALKAAAQMAESLGEDGSGYLELYERGRAYMERELFNGEYFIQKTQWTGLRTGSPIDNPNRGIPYSEEAKALFEKEGPKYQYGTGCLSDGVLGAWMAMVCGVGEILDPHKVRSHLLAVYRYNLKRDLSGHANPQRPTYALGHEGGLLLCTWPRGGAPSLPFVYSNEVWTGIEYQVAAHLMMTGCVNEGLEIVRLARARYDGRVRNPFDEYECGHWYARAMSSYSLLQALTGVRYDAVDGVLYIEPRIQGDVHTFISTQNGGGTAGVRNGKPFFDQKWGGTVIRTIAYTPCEN